MLVIAVCTDIFFSSFAYAQNKIKIPFCSAIVISFIGAGVLTVSIQFSDILSQCISTGICTFIGSLLLFIMGAVCLFNNLIKELLKTHFKNNVFIDECCADKDNSKVLTIGEALVLSTALSIDAIASGLGAGLTGCRSWICGIIALLLGILSIYSGTALGNYIKSKKGRNFSFIGGIVLIILAIKQ